MLGLDQNFKLRPKVAKNIPAKISQAFGRGPELEEGTDSTGKEGKYCI